MSVYIDESVDENLDWIRGKGRFMRVAMFVVYAVPI